MAKSIPGQLLMFDPPISRGSPTHTGSPASADGPTPCGSPATPTTAPRSGPDPAHANLSPRQAREKGLLTSGTSGLTGSGTSSSAALASSLVSRFRAQTASCGSTLYSLTWKGVATPQGRWIAQLRASGRRTSASASGGPQSGWPTPVSNDALKLGQITPRPGMICLVAASQMAGWPTPKAEDAESTGFSAKRLEAGKIPDNLHSATKLLAPWPTPAAIDATTNRESAESKASRGSGGVNLTTAAGWATPNARDYRTPAHKTYRERGGGAKGENLNHQVPHAIPGASLNGLPASTGGAGLLNPAFSLWLLGYPATWLASAQPGTRSRRSSPPSSSKPTSQPEPEGESPC